MSGIVSKWVVREEHTARRRRRAHSAQVARDRGGRRTGLMRPGRHR